MGKILVFFSLCVFIPFAHSLEWRDARTKFNELHESLLDFGQQAIRSHCGGSWLDNLMGLTDKGSYLSSLDKCSRSMDEQYSLKYTKSLNVMSETALDKWKKIFPEHKEAVQSMSQEIQRHKEAAYFIHINGLKVNETVWERDISPEEKAAASVLRKSSVIGLIKEDAFYHARQEFLKEYKCVRGTSVQITLEGCYRGMIPESDKQCIDNYGFTKCRPFLKSNGCKPEAVLALASELSKEDKTGMTYICWKAATQGAQCCMNPDQCPTDSAFRSIATQLQKAAPGMVQAFAGLEAIKGDYQKACEMNLMANAAGPLAKLQTKTCGDSVNTCEETCDKKVQEFKENFKLAVTGRPKRGQKPLTIDEIVGTAQAIHKEDSDSIPDTEEEIADIKTCSQAVVYLDSLFKDKKENKKIRSLSEKLSHASLVDCSGEVFKHSGSAVRQEELVPCPASTHWQLKCAVRVIPMDLSRLAFR